MHFFLLTLLLFANSAYPQSGDQLQLLLQEAKGITNRPSKIPELAQKIQTYFFKTKSKPHPNKAGLIELAKVHSRLVNYLRLAEDLNSSACNLDRTRKSERGLEILSGSLGSSMCQSWDSGFIQNHSEVASLIQNIKVIEEGYYSGSYTVDEKGELRFPWEISKQNQHQYHWQSVLSPKLFDPYSKESTLEFRDELYKQSLKDTFHTFLHLRTAYGAGQVDPEILVKDFCKDEQGCPKSLRPYFLRLVKESNSKRITHSYVYASKVLNLKIDALNSLVSRLRNNTTPIHDEFIFVKTGKKVMKGAKFTDTVQAGKDYRAYQKLHAEISVTGPGLFIATEELQKNLSLKPFEAMAFQTFHPRVTPEKFRKALGEAQVHTFKHGKELVSIYHSKRSPQEKVEEFLLLNPAAASTVLVNRPEFGKTACRGLNGISLTEMNDRQKRLLATWGGAIVGGALIFTGLGPVPLALAGMAVKAPGLALTYQAYQRAAMDRNSAYAELNGAKVRRTSAEVDKSRKDLQMSAGYMATGVLGQMFRGMEIGKTILRTK